MKNMILLYLCIIFLPLLEAILIYCFGRYMGKSLRIWGLLISFYHIYLQPFSFQILITQVRLP